jgi:hypothetical protein
MWAWFVVSVSWSGLVQHSLPLPTSTECQMIRAKLHEPATYCAQMRVKP